MNEDKMISTPNAFSLFIEQLSIVKKKSKLDTILEYCAENYIDPCEVAPNINKSLKEKIIMELQEDGKLPQNSSSIIC